MVNKVLCCFDNGAVYIYICYAHLGGQNNSREWPNFSCECAPHSLEVSRDFRKIKNASYSLKCPTHFPEILGTFYRFYGDSQLLCWSALALLSLKFYNKGVKNDLFDDQNYFIHKKYICLKYSLHITNRLQLTFNWRNYCLMMMLELFVYFRQKCYILYINYVIIQKATCWLLTVDNHICNNPIKRYNRKYLD